MSEVPVSMVNRVVTILQAFEGDQARLSLAEIASASGLPRSSTHRILQQLVDARLIERIDREYRLGLGIFELGSLVPHRNRLVFAARPVMQKLSASGHVVAHLAVLDQREVVYLEKIGGVFAGTLPSRIGGRFDAHCTGVGKAILAHLTNTQLEQYLSLSLEGHTASSITDSEKLKNELDVIKQRGYATETGEAVQGVSCVAAPIFHGNLAVAAISICGPTQHLDPSKLRDHVRMAATSVARQLNQGRMPLAMAG